jgi:hypothetical protein
MGTLIVVSVKSGRMMLLKVNQLFVMKYRPNNCLLFFVRVTAQHLVSHLLSTSHSVRARFSFLPPQITNDPIRDVHRGNAMRKQ